MSDIIQPQDKRYYVQRPDASFSPERNRAIIQETIVSTRKFFAELNKLDSEGKNRVDILSSYALYRLGGRGHKSFKDYAGRKLHSRLIGEKILSKVRVMETTNRLRGNKRYSNFIQL